MSTVFRVEKTANYTVMSNTHLKDRRLSYKSKGLLSVILSLPPDWDYTITGLSVIAADGVDSVKTAIKELEQYGYVISSLCSITQSQPLAITLRILLTMTFVRALFEKRFPDRLVRKDGRFMYSP